MYLCHMCVYALATLLCTSQPPSDVEALLQEDNDMSELDDEPSAAAETQQQQQQQQHRAGSEALEVTAAAGEWACA